MKTEKSAKTVVEAPQSAEKKEQLKLDAKVYALRTKDAKKNTWSALDELVYGAKKSHGGRSYTAFHREEKRLKTEKRAAAQPTNGHVKTVEKKKKEVIAISAPVKRSHKRKVVTAVSAPEPMVGGGALVCGGVTEEVNGNN